MARTVLEMDVHCTDCAKKIRKAIQNIYGVEKVSASPDTGLVVINGTADAEALRSRVERKLERKVSILSRTVDAHWAPPPQPHHGGWVMPPRRYPHAGGNHWAPPPLPRPMPRHAAPQRAYPRHAGNGHWAPPLLRRRHVSRDVRARHRDDYDDEEGPENCCAIQ